VDFKEIRLNGWVHLAQHRAQWCADVNLLKKDSALCNLFVSWLINLINMWEVLSYKPEGRGFDSR
jgi:hypothetical protein